MATTTLSHALAECLESLREGESLNECLKRYPEHRESLRPLLEVAQALKESRADIRPSAYFISELKTKLGRGKNKSKKGGEAHRKRR